MTQTELFNKLVSGSPGTLTVRLLAEVPLPWDGVAPLPEVTWGGYARSPLAVELRTVDDLRTYCVIQGTARFNVASGRDSESAAGFAVTIKDDRDEDVIIAVIPIPSALILRRSWNNAKVSITCMPYKGPNP